MTRSNRSFSSKPPDEASLYDAALAHLARYAATEAGLRRVLERRIERWARRSGEEDRHALAMQVSAAKEVVSRVIARLAASGAVNDAAFAESRARNLARAGRSRRAMAAQLIAKGVDPDLAQTSIPDNAETELAAALATARRRRIGPFRIGNSPDVAGRRRELAVLARAGFTQSIASQALAIGLDEAEELIIRLRRS